MPQGVQYSIGSATNGVTDINLTNPDSVVFSLPDLPKSNAFDFSIWLKASCMTNHSSLKNKLYFSFDGDNGTGGQITSNQIFTSQLYSVQFPDLSILSMSNQSYTGSIGDIFQRCITLTNGGTGALHQFTIKHMHGNGLSIISHSLGGLTNSTGSSIYTLSGNDFATIGNGDTLFDPGESITLCEDIKIISCENGSSSDYIYSWGCGGQVCKSKSEAANIVFTNESPHLVVTKHNNFTANSSGLGSYCYGENNPGDFPSWTVITNDGTGTAYNSTFDIGQNYGNYTNLFSTNFLSSFAPGSFTIKKNGGTAHPFTPDSLYTSGDRYCFHNPINAFSFSFDSIQPGDTIVIKWSHLTCLPASCTNGTFNYFTWRLEGKYYNKCGEKSILAQTRKGPTYPSISNKLLLDSSPGTITDTTTQTMSFKSDYSRIHIPYNGADSKFRYQLIFPDNCLDIDLNSFIISNSSGTTSTNNYTTSSNGDTINIILNNFYPGSHWKIEFNLKKDCSSCQGGAQTIQMNTAFQPDTNCNSWFPLGCASSPIDIICGNSCDNISIVDAKFQRITVGLPDNNNDGLPDGTGSLDPTKARFDKLMYNDTAQLTNNIYVHNDTQRVYTHIVLQQEIGSVGNQVEFIPNSVKVRFYEAGTGNASTCNVPITPTNILSGTTRNLTYNIPLNSISCIPTGYLLKTGDSLNFSCLYVSKHSNSSITSGTVKSKAFGTTIPYYSTNFPDSMKFYCIDHITRQFSLVGYYFTNAANNAPKIIQDCDEFWMSQNYYLSIGPCCSNYAGGNMFPFEYRHFAHPDSFKITIPNNFTYVDARFNYIRTKGSSGTAYPYQSLVPSSINGNNYYFDVSSFFDIPGSSAPFPYSDDGFYGSVQIKLKPNCAVVDSVLKNMGYHWYFGVVPRLNSSPIPKQEYRLHDPILYNAPRLSLQSNLLTVNSQNGQEQWTLTVGNTSPISDANNFWIATPSSSSTINGDSLLDVANNIMLYPSPTGMFDIGNEIEKNSTRKFILYTTATSCTIDSLRVYAGWDCNPVPADINGLTCTPLSVLLTIKPLMPAIETSVTQNTGFNAKLCDTLTFSIKVRDYQLGYGFHLITDAQLPYGLSYVPTSSTLTFKGTTNSISDPTSVGQSLTWDLSNNSLLSNGLSGLDGTSSQNDNYYIITFKVIPKCGFVSGSTIFSSTHCNAYCGSSHTSEKGFSNPIIIDDLSTTYSTTIHIGIDYIIPCGTNNNMTISVVNNGPGIFNSTDSITITLPDSITYESGSFVAIHNGNISNSAPIVQSAGGLTYLTWPLDSTVTAGDSMTFSINLDMDPFKIPCDILEIRAQTSSLTVAACSVGGATCEVGNVTGNTEKSLFTYKTDFKVSDSLATLTMDANGNETINGEFTLFNQGATLGTSTPLDIKFYNDVDNNGVLSYANDTLIDSALINILVTAGSDYNYSFSNLPGKNVCNLIVVLSDTNNPCFCSNLIFPISLNFQSSNFIDSTCSSDTITIGNPDIGGYTYTWQNAPELSTSSIAQPQFTATNNTDSTVTHMLYRTIDRGVCTLKDTSFIVVNPIPHGQLFNNQILCVNDSTPKVIFKGSNGTGPYTFYYSIENHHYSVVSTSAEDTANKLFPSTFPDTITIHLDSISDASTSICWNKIDTSISIMINPLPSGSLLGSDTLCVNDSLPGYTFHGESATSPYTFYYTLNGITNSLNTNIDSTLYLPTAVDTTFLIVLDSIEDSSPTNCKLKLSDTVFIRINPLPNGSLLGSDTICLNDPSPAYSFHGESATAPYTFYYTINGYYNFVNASTDTTLHLPSTIDTTYHVILDSIIDASLTTCKNTFSDTATIRVNPLPTGTISGSTIVCMNDPEPKLTFVGADGAGPYTFYFTINGVNDSISTQNQNDSVQISIPTVLPDTFLVVLDSLRDSSPSLCSNVISDTLKIIVSPLPKGKIIGTQEVCVNATNPKVTFIGEEGTPPYTFYFTKNGIPDSITSQTLTDSSLITIQTTQSDTVTVVLDSIKDTSPSVCWQVINDSVTVIIHPLPKGNIVGGAEICQNDPSPIIIFNGKNANSYQFQYTINGQPHTLSINQQQEGILVPTLSPGTYNYNLNMVIDPTTGCSQYLNDEVTIIIHPKPIAIFSTHPDQIKESKNTVTLNNNSSGAKNYFWDFGDGETSYLPHPNHQFSTENIGKQYTIMLIASSEYNCVDTAFNVITVVEDMLIYVPNTFTPDGRKYNNEFYPVISQGFNLNNYHLQIFNRWGELIFETKDYSEHWNGKYKGKLCPDGTYVWKLKIENKNGIMTQKIGNVNLIR